VLEDPGALAGLGSDDGDDVDHGSPLNSGTEPDLVWGRSPI
jgi:hypothetical protein